MTEKIRNDLELYDRHAADWWDPRSAAFRSLHAVNEFRRGLIHEWLGERLVGALVVDLGCGGGLLAEPLAHSGARVLGVDLSHGSLSAASQRPGEGERVYVRGDLAKAPVASGVADIAILADVLEHVPDVGAAVAEAARVLKPEGLLYVNTINRTWRAHLLAVTVAEGLKLVPRGTHDPAMFVRPRELLEHAARHGLASRGMQGEAPAVWSTLRAWTVRLRKSRSLAVMYSALFQKDGLQ